MSGWTFSMKVTVDTAVLDRMVAQAPGKANNGLVAACTQMETDIKMLIQKKQIIDTGALLNSIRFFRMSDLKYLVSDGVEYGIYQEFGTRRGIVPRPFFVPGVEKTAQNLASYFIQVFR